VLVGSSQLERGQICRRRRIACGTGVLVSDLVPVTASAASLVPVVPRRPSELPVRVYLARLGPGSRPGQLSALMTSARVLSSGACDADTLPWEQLRYPHTAALRAWLAERYAPATANRHLASVRGVLKECWMLGLIAAEDYHRAAGVQGVKGTRLPAGRGLAAGELRALFAATVDGSPSGARDAALVAVLYGGGLRREEAVALELADYDPEAGSLRVRGKGDRERLAYATNGGRDALEDWIRARGPGAGPLFVPVDGPPAGGRPGRTFFSPLQRAVDTGRTGDCRQPRRTAVVAGVEG
jgi:integrase